MTETTAVAKKAEKQNGGQLRTVSERFVAQVQTQFVAEMGSALQFTDYEKTLAQHMYLKVDSQIKAQAAKGTPIEWSKVNLNKLALDTVHRIGLGLDALIPNHIHPIPYLNNKTGKYDLDLRIGYVGKDYCRRKMAVEQPLDIDYQLVYDTDKFVPIMKSIKNEIESFEFEIANPFDRGKVLGGFGYISYQDPKKNKLVMVTMRDFNKARAASKTADFWGEAKWEQEMMFKTLVHRVTDKISLDPTKVNAKSYAYVDAQESEDGIDREIAENANRGMIDARYTVVDEETGEIGNEPEQQPETPQPPATGSELQPTGAGGPGY
jgi:recombination protein RecT